MKPQMQTTTGGAWAPAKTKAWAPGKIAAVEPPRQTVAAAGKVSIVGAGPGDPELEPYFARLMGEGSEVAYQQGDARERFSFTVATPQPFALATLLGALG